MEKPFSGRAKISESVRDLKIEIPSKKNWFLIIFITAWLGGWLMGELFALTMVFGHLFGLSFGDFNFGNGMPSFAFFFILFWLIAWTAGGIVTIRTWLWMVFGEEIITFNSQILQIEKKGTFFTSPKKYDLREVKNLVLNVNSTSSSIWGTKTYQNSWNLGSEGILKFDYGMKTIKIAEGIDEAEGRYLLERIKNANLIN